jgi:hypothetical protein
MCSRSRWRRPRRVRIGVVHRGRTAPRRLRRSGRAEGRARPDEVLRAPVILYAWTDHDYFRNGTWRVVENRAVESKAKPPVEFIEMAGLDEFQSVDYHGQRPPSGLARRDRERTVAVELGAELPAYLPHARRAGPAYPTRPTCLERAHVDGPRGIIRPRPTPMARRHCGRQPRPPPRSPSPSSNSSCVRCDRSPASSPRFIAASPACSRT